MFSFDKVNIDIQDFFPLAAAAPVPQSNQASQSFTVFSNDRCFLKAQANPSEISQENVAAIEFGVLAPLFKKFSSLSEDLSIEVEEFSCSSNNKSQQLPNLAEQAISIQTNEFSL